MLLFIVHSRIQSITSCFIAACPYTIFSCVIASFVPSPSARPLLRPPQNNWRLIKAELEGQCATNKWQWKFSPQLCAALKDTCYEWWRMHFDEVCAAQLPQRCGKSYSVTSTRYFHSSFLFYRKNKTNSIHKYLVEYPRYFLATIQMRVRFFRLTTLL